MFPTLDDLEASAAGTHAGIGYGLHGLPTVTDLQSAVAELEGGARGFAVPSGLAATTLPLLALTPQVLYSESPSLNSQEWLFGLSLTIAF